MKFCYKLCLLRAERISNPIDLSVRDEKSGKKTYMFFINL